MRKENVGKEPGMTEAEIKKLIKDRINALLNAKDTTMRQLSHELGFSDGYLNQIMNNDMTPSLQAILAISEACNMSVSDFFNVENAYPLEYYKVNKELQKMSVARLEALYILICDAVDKS